MPRLSLLLLLAWAGLAWAAPGGKQDPARFVAEGDYRFQDDDIDGAEACYRKALAVKSDWAAAFRGLGDVLLARGDLQAAQTFYRKALKDPGTQAKALAGLGYVKYEMNAKDSAALFLGQALALDTANVDLEVFLAQTYREIGNKAQAIRLARIALKSDPGRKEAIFLLRDLGVEAEEVLVPEGIDKVEKAPEALE